MLDSTPFRPTSPFQALSLFCVVVGPVVGFAAVLSVKVGGEAVRFPSSFFCFFQCWGGRGEGGGGGEGGGQGLNGKRQTADEEKYA